jgi:type IV pilus assembly protein PilE
MAKKQAGVTLIELLVVMAIIAILVSIAYPSYQQYTRRAQRSQAKAILQESAQILERKFTETNSYAGLASPYEQSPKDGTAVYTISLASDATTFTLTASPVAGGIADDGSMTGGCGTLSINQLGQKISDGDVATCWNK